MKELEKSYWSTKLANSEKIKRLKIKELFSSNDEYKIPIYQRNYAWGKAQIEQLIQDVLDFSGEYKDKPYYIGTLVVYERNNGGKILYETIDGQQRLTTLLILLSVLKNNFGMKFNFKHLLTYESRESSNKTFDLMYANNDFTDDCNMTMKNAYETIKSKLHKEKIKLEFFEKYLLENVEILRVSVPDDTELNHYFEIMNNRGEQLEKHEVLKSQMLSELDQKERFLFSKIWNACSDMSRYVQYGFSTVERDVVFSKTWNEISFSGFDDILKTIEDKELTKNAEEFEKDNTLEAIINPKKKIDVEVDNEKNRSERFTSPVNFQNFLLHVLRIQVMNSQKDCDNFDSKLPLDDKRLIETFNTFMKDRNFVKDFGFNLLKLRSLFDKYIIKRDYNDNTEDGKWSLLKAFKNEKQNNIQYGNSFSTKDEKNENDNLIMLLSMFHVSNPSQIYKHWLTAALNYLFRQNTNNINAYEYINYLEDIARMFFKRYLSKNEVQYSDIIFFSSEINFEIDKSKLDQGTNVENFIFNYLDYLLWKKDKENHKGFSFSFKSSVEHVYPQNPKDGQPKLDKEVLDCFGNLCLISASKNSALSNYQPKAKSEHYYESGYDSLKQKIIIEPIQKKGANWWIDEIKQHQYEMMVILGLENDPI